MPVAPIRAFRLFAKVSQVFVFFTFLPYPIIPARWCTIVLDSTGTIVHDWGMANLINETVQLAKSTTMTVAEICRAAQIKPRWYHKLIAGEFKDPGFNKVTRLNRVLKGKAA